MGEMRPQKNQGHKMTRQFFNDEFISAFERLPRIHSMGLMIFDPIWSEKTHLTHNCEMLNIVKGTINLEIGDQHILASAGDTLLIPSHTSHRDIFNIESGLELFGVFFSWDGEDEFFTTVSNHAIKAFSVSQKNGINKVFDSMRLDLMSGSDEIDLLLAQSRLMNILVLILKNALYNESDKKQQSELNYGKLKRKKLIDQAKEYMEHHYHEPISLDAIAEDLKISPFYLSRIFSMESNFSLFTYLTDLRMNKAMELLERENFNISEVAAMVGYENSGYFSKVFKKNFGKSPSGV